MHTMQNVPVCLLAAQDLPFTTNYLSWCRRELAARVHMLDHGQLGPPTPAGRTPAGSRRASMQQSSPPSSRPQSMTFVAEVDGNAKTPFSLSISALGPGDLIAGVGAGNVIARLSALSTADDGERDAGVKGTGDQASELPPLQLPQTPKAGEGLPSEVSLDAAQELGLRLSNAVLATPNDTQPPVVESSPDVTTAQVNGNQGSDVNGERVDLTQHLNASTGDMSRYPTTHFSNPPDLDLAAVLAVNPKLAALRSPSGILPTPSTLLPPARPVSANIRPAILANAKCSGYFVEPVCISL